MLVLGSGIGSIVQVLHKNGCRPRITLIEQDKVVLKWAMELFDNAHEKSIVPICMDAERYMEQNTVKYDFVFIDIFNGLEVPEFVCSASFLQLCKDAVAPGGHVALNYISADLAKWDIAHKTFTTVFPGSKVIIVDTNKILAC